MRIQEITPYDTESGIGDITVQNSKVRYFHTKDGAVCFDLNGYRYELVAKKCKH